mgnify:CR=1 FL=1
MIFSDDSRINEIGLVILDEVHYLADKERGATWEEIIIHLPKKIKMELQTCICLVSIGLMIVLELVLVLAIQFHTWCQ